MSKNKFNSMPEDFETWATRRLAAPPSWEEHGIPYMYEGTNGQGEKDYLKALVAGALCHPERLPEWAERVNRERAIPLFSPEEVRHKIEDARKTAATLPSRSGRFKTYSQDDYFDVNAVIEDNGNCNSQRVEPRRYYSAKKLCFKRNVFEQSIKDMPEISEEWFMERSKIDPTTVSAADYLLSLYRRGDVLFITNKKKARCADIWAEIANPENWRNRLEQLAEGKNPAGVWYVPNSVTGQAVTKANGKPSWRSKENVNRFEYHVFEADVLTAAEQLKLLAVLPLPIVAIYFSGGKSYHALMRVNLENPTREAWEKYVGRLKRPLVERGADAAMFQIQQMCRLPQCRRGAERQRLIYFNPEPILEGSLWTHEKSV
jgi:hypothetical protein